VTVTTWCPEQLPKGSAVKHEQERLCGHDDGLLCDNFAATETAHASMLLTSSSHHVPYMIQVQLHIRIHVDTDMQCVLTGLYMFVQLYI